MYTKLINRYYNYSNYSIFIAIYYVETIKKKY